MEVARISAKWNHQLKEATSFIEGTVSIEAFANMEIKAMPDVSHHDSHETTELFIIRPKVHLTRSNTKAVPTISTSPQIQAGQKRNNKRAEMPARKTCLYDKAISDINGTPNDIDLDIGAVPDIEAAPGYAATAEIAFPSFVSTLKARLRAIKLDHSYEKTKKKVSPLKDFLSNLTDDICRICEGRKSLMNLFDERNGHLLLMLKSVADISIDADDGLPKYICKQCDDGLEQAYNFKLRCESTDRKLRLQQAYFSSEICPSSGQFENIDVRTKNCEISDIMTYDKDPNTDHIEEILVQEYASVVDMIVEDKSDHSLLEDPLQYGEKEEIQPDQGIEFAGDSDGVGNIKVEDNLVEKEEEKGDVDQECENSDNYIIEYEAIEKTKESPQKESNDDANVNGECSIKTERAQKRSNNKIFGCNSCSASFTRITDLNVHKKRHGNKRFQCPTCSKWFSRLYKMKVHMLIHEVRIEFPCTMCGKKYTNRGNLVRHVSHFHNQERRYKCQICGSGFTRSAVLRDHLAVHSEERNFECNLCNKKFKTLYYLKAHKKLHIDIEIPHSLKTTEICLCPYCGKTTNQLTAHEAHLRTHTGEKPFECPTCNRRFTCQQALKPHLLTHTGEKPFRCDICGVAFRQSTHLKGHKLIHSGVKKHKCQYCEKAFALRRNLTVHRRLHTGEKPYKCHICTKRFHDSNGLKRHKFSHSKNGRIPSHD